MIRPFDKDDDRLAIIEKRGWHFDCVVANEEQFGDVDAEMHIYCVDVPLTEEPEKKSAIVVFNEAYLIDLTKRIMEMNMVYAQYKGEDTSIVDTRNVFMYKRTAVSYALEDLLDELDIWIDDQETD